MNMPYHSREYELNREHRQRTMNKSQEHALASQIQQKPQLSVALEQQTLTDAGSSQTLQPAQPGLT